MQEQMERVINSYQAVEELHQINYEALTAYGTQRCLNAHLQYEFLSAEMGEKLKEVGLVLEGVGK